MTRVVELEIPARADFLAVARLVVVAAASVDAGLSEDRLDNLRLAVSEACVNAINAHDRSGAADDHILIRCGLSGDRVEVEVVDRGAGFDPASVPSLPAPTDPSRLDFEGGLGLQLMRTLTDETDIRSGSDGTAVRLVVYTEPHQGRP